MQTQPAETTTKTAEPPANGFKHVRQTIAYGDMAAIRNELAEFLQLRGISGGHIGNAQLIVTEILSNLVKHPARAADHIEIRAQIEGARITLDVLDNSTSFANFDAKCKTALSRLHAGVTAEECGYGLGCILTHSEDMLYVPLAASPDSLNHFRISYDARRTVDAAPKAENKIFLVDDDPVSLMIHQRMLNGAYKVISFEHAEEALAAFSKEQPDVIISDLVMPAMDGIALRKALDGVENGNTTPFIFLSGKSAGEDNPYISHLGVDDFLCKPVSAARLNTVLARLLHRSKQLRGAVQSQFHHDITALLKPALPESYGLWKFITHHKPAEAGGGDFILHQQTQTNFMAVLIDVMGHGRQAKFFSYVYAGYLRSLFRMYAGTLDASHFLRHLSQSVADDPLLETTIMTCLCFHVFPEGILKIASAGHPCPILIRGARAALLDVRGPLPGLVGDCPYDMKSFRLEPGDRVLFMTDGFLESFDRRGYAAEEMLKLIDAAPAATASALSQYLWQAFEAQQQKQNRLKDDATIIIAAYGEKI